MFLLLANFFRDIVGSDSMVALRSSKNDFILFLLCLPDPSFLLIVFLAAKDLVTLYTVERFTSTISAMRLKGIMGVEQIDYPLPFGLHGNNEWPDEKSFLLKKIIRESLFMSEEKYGWKFETVWSTRPEHTLDFFA